MLNQHKIEKAVGLLLDGLGVSRKDRNFTDTPERVARFYLEMFQKTDTEFATFPEEYNDFVMLRGHEMWTLCPHHLLPVKFKVYLAYIPNGEVLGLSKLARIMDEMNSMPLLQERFTADLPARVAETCNANGTACLVEGEHDCSRIRGVKSTAPFVTYHLEGEFRTNLVMENRFFNLVKA